MKNFFDNFFKPYIFPILILIAGAFLRKGENLDSISKYFSKSTNSFLQFFSTQFYLWEVILYMTIIFVLTKVYNLIFKSKTSRERIMLRAIKKAPLTYDIDIRDTTDKFLFKYQLSIDDGEYSVDNLVPYCKNCSPRPVRMSTYSLGDFRCNCGKYVDYGLCKDVKSGIITHIEALES